MTQEVISPVWQGMIEDMTVRNVVMDRHPQRRSRFFQFDGVAWHLHNV